MNLQLPYRFLGLGSPTGAATIFQVAQVGMALSLFGGGLHAAESAPATNAPTATAVEKPSVPYTYPAPPFNALAWRPYPGLFNTWLREQNPEFNNWNIGAWSRFRYERRATFLWGCCRWSVVSLWSLRPIDGPFATGDRLRPGRQSSLARRRAASPRRCRRHSPDCCLCNDAVEGGDDWRRNAA